MTEVRKGPTRLGGRAAPPAPVMASQVAEPEAGNARAREGTHGAATEGMPADVVEALGQQIPAPAPVASNVASNVANQQASQGEPNSTSGISFTASSLLAPAIPPDRDLHNPGWRYPRYFCEAVRLLAFQLRKNQQEIAIELMHSALSGLELGGPLAGVSREHLRDLVHEAYREASKTR